MHGVNLHPGHVNCKKSCQKHARAAGGDISLKRIALVTNHKLCNCVWTEIYSEFVFRNNCVCVQMALKAAACVLCFWGGGLGLSGFRGGGFLFFSLFFWNSVFSFLWCFTSLNTFVVFPVCCKAFLHFYTLISSLKYSHMTFLFHSAVPLLHLSLCMCFVPSLFLCVCALLCLFLSVCLCAHECCLLAFAWYSWVIWQYIIKTQCSVSPCCDWRGTWKHRSHDTGIDQYWYQLWYGYYRYLDWSTHH